MNRLYSFICARFFSAKLFCRLLSCLIAGCGLLAYQPLLAQYCQPVWEGTSCGSANGDDIINVFNMNNVNDQNIGCPPVDPNFIDKVATTCVTACAGGTYTVTVSPGYFLTGNDEYFAVYIDFNGNGTFEPNEFFPLGSSLFGSAVTGTITIPTGLPSSSTRLRVLCQSLSQGVPPTVNDACGNNVTYGEAVDYCITITNAPVINLGSDTEQCGGVRLLEAGNEGATFLWSDSSTSGSLLAITSGNYSVTVTASSGCSASASANVYIKPVPVVNLGPDISQCGGSVILNAGNAGSGFVWSDGSTAQNFTVDSTGSYSVTVTNLNNSCAASDTVNVTINQAPTLNFGPSINQCGGTVTLDAINVGSTYIWSNGSTDETLLVTSSGYYAVTVTNPSGCSVTAAQVVTISPIPPIGDDTTFSICPDTTANLLLYYPNFGYVSYTWTAPNPAAAGAGSYVLTVVNESGCTNTANVTINNFPVPILGPPTTISICPGNSTDLTAVYPNNGFATYQWNTPTPTTVAAGVYTLTVTNIDGCANTVSATVDNYPKPNAGPDLTDSICPGTTANLDSVIADTGYTIYVWNAPNPLVVSPGIYTLVVTNSDGCTDTANASIVNYEMPAISIAAFHDVCITATPFVLSGGLPLGGVYMVDGVVQTLFDPNAEGIGNHLITYTFTTYSGCIESVDTSIVVHPQPYLTVDTALSLMPVCSSSAPIDLNNYMNYSGGFYSGSGVSGYYFYPKIAFADTNVITDIYTDSFGCMDTSVFPIIVQPSVHVLFSSSVADFTICTRQEITFTASSADEYQFFVNDSAQGPASPDSTFSTSGLTNHSAVFVVGSNLCSTDTSEEIIIDVIPPPVVSAGLDTTIQLGQSVQLHGTAIGVTSLIYLWSPDTGLNFTNVLNPTYSGSDSITFWFKATDTYGCSDSAQVNVYVNIPDNVLLPNIITPDGDGKNDVWKLNPKINLDGSHLVIFSRWGETVYEADNYNNDWGGTYRGSGKKLPDGTYYYVLSVPAQHNHLYKGAINVLSGEAK